MSIVRPLVGAAGKTEATCTQERFAAAYRELFLPLYRYVRFRVGDPTLAEDIVAATFERALHRLATIRQPERLRPWLFTIARHAIADHFRYQHPTADLASVDNREDLLATSPEDEAVRRDELRRLIACLQRLPEREREVLGLRFVARFSHREIADILALSEANVAQIAHRALARVRQDCVEVSR